MRKLEDILAFFRKTVAPSRSVNAPPPPPVILQGALNYRAAVHEAGHAIAAWNCTVVYSVDRVELKSLGCGITSYSMIQPLSAAGDWCRIVIALAGVAAEMHLLGNAKTIPSEGDLSGARRFAQEALSQKAFSPPWNITEGPTQDFHSFFQKPLTKHEARVLRESYRKARQLIVFHERQLRALVHELILQQEMDAARVIKVLGDRAYIRVLNFFQRESFFPG